MFTYFYDTSQNSTQFSIYILYIEMDFVIDPHLFPVYLRTSFFIIVMHLAVELIIFSSCNNHRRRQTTVPNWLNNCCATT